MQKINKLLCNNNIKYQEIIRINTLSAHVFKIITKIEDIFEGLPNNIFVFQSHKDIVLTIPKSAKILAENNICIQAFRFQNFLCVQFHPEITYNEAYAMITRDNKSLDLLSQLNEDYDLPTEIILNFVNY
jgi:GMP synthase-like glutamine amidotransferase